MPEKLTETPIGKIGIGVVAVVAVGAAVFMGMHTMGNQEEHADQKEVQADAQKQIDQIKNNPNIPPELKAQELAQFQGLAKGSSGHPSGPPTGSSSGH